MPSAFYGNPLNAGNTSRLCRQALLSASLPLTGKGWGRKTRWLGHLGRLVDNKNAVWYRRYGTALSAKRSAETDMPRHGSWRA